MFNKKDAWSDQVAQGKNIKEAVVGVGPAVTLDILYN